MAKKYGSGVYLGTTRRQRSTRVRNVWIVLAGLLVTVLLSVFFVDWLLDAQSVGANTDGDALLAQDSAAETDMGGTASLPADTGAPADDVTAAETMAPGAVAVTGDWYKPIHYDRRWVVMLDPGHGFDDIGTASALLGDTNEATINLDIALRVQEILADAPEVVVLMTHDTNAVDGRVSAADGGEPPLNNLVLLTPEDRAMLANGQDIDLFVSIHCDSIPEKPEVSGLRTYFCDDTEFSDMRDSASERLATNIANSFGLEFGDEAVTPAVRSLSEDNAFYVVRKIGVPSVLCEVGFVTNETDAANMLNEEWRQRAAEGIAEGILAYIARSE